MTRLTPARWFIIGAAVLGVAGLVWWLLRPAPTVAFLGDSISVVASPEIKAELGSDYTPDVAAALGIEAGQMIPAGQAAAAKNPDQVVIELGSNDVLHGASLNNAEVDLLKLITLFPNARCIHMVNINTNMTDNGRPVGTGAGMVNTALSHLHAADKRIDIIDWNQIVSADVAAHPPGGTLTADTVHPNPAGRALLAHAIKTALDNCN